MEYLRDANERQTRQFAAIIAERNGRHGVSLVCSILDVSRNTVYRGLHELDRGEHFNEGRVRRKGGGRKSTLSKHPELRAHWLLPVPVVVCLAMHVWLMNRHE